MRFAYNDIKEAKRKIIAFFKNVKTSYKSYTNLIEEYVKRKLDSAINLLIALIFIIIGTLRK